jgi:hypothetical protein
VPNRIRNVEVPVISTGEAGACPPGSDARLAGIRRLLLDDTLAFGDRIAGCLVTLYGQQVSTIAALRATDTSCAAGATRLKLGADWLGVPGPVAALLRQHLRNRTNMTAAAHPVSPWLFPGQLGVSPGTAMRHAFPRRRRLVRLRRRKRAHTPDDKTLQQAIVTECHHPPRNGHAISALLAVRSVAVPVGTAPDGRLCARKLLRQFLGYRSLALAVGGERHPVPAGSSGPVPPAGMRR